MYNPQAAQWAHSIFGEAIQDFNAVRLMQLQEISQNSKQAECVSCEVCVEKLTWQLLWMKTDKSKPLPKKAPSLYWFYYALAKRGGWHDSKRNGRVGIKALWLGWCKLMEMVESAKLLKSIQLTTDL